MLCLEALLGIRTLESLQTSWSNHRGKLEHAHVWALLNVASYPETDVVNRLEAVVSDDSATKLRGFYVDPGPGRAVLGPEMITHEQAAELVELVAAAVVAAGEMELEAVRERLESPLADELRDIGQQQLEQLRRMDTDVAGLPEPDRTDRIRAIKEAIDVDVATFRRVLYEDRSTPEHGRS